MESRTDARAMARKMKFDPAYLAAFEQKLFIEGQGKTRRLTNFFVLLLLATVIATLGLVAGSTATIIGAMIVAPLMEPIMATAAAAVMGSARRVLYALALTIAGIIAVILLSMLLALIVPEVNLSFTENAELASRINPGLVALLTALASGAAGAYITAREEISDAMGGVAIAISLVPPLCVVGIGLRLGDWGAAAGALELFATNLLAILLAGGVVFLLAGLGRHANRGEQTRVRIAAFSVILVATILIAVPLSVTTFQAIEGALQDRAAGAAVVEWLAGTAYQTVQVNVSGESVVALVEGSGELKPLGALADSLAATLKHPVVVNLRVIQSQLQPSGAPAP